MSAKHTPGPWMVLPSVVHGQFAILTEHGRRKDIACTYGFQGDPREANARLIAAAPELLEALQEAADYTRHPDYDWPVEFSRLVRAAIAKATGEAA